MYNVLCAARMHHRLYSPVKSRISLRTHTFPHAILAPLGRGEALILTITALWDMHCMIIYMYGGSSTVSLTVSCSGRPPGRRELMLSVCSVTTLRI